MQLSVIGTGYVGLVAGACFADSGRDVLCADVDERKIAALLRGEIPLHEPGLEELVTRNSKAGRLRFTSKPADAMKEADVVFLAVGTPSLPDGSVDTRALDETVRCFLEHGRKDTILVIKSTVPVGTADRIRATVEKAGFTSDIVSNPEFLKEGTAVSDFQRPERVVIGCKTDRAREVLRELYAPLLRNGKPLLCLSNRGAELGKYAANAYLATRISFINDMATLAEMLGADVREVREVMGSDSRIGRQFLYPGCGYGGSCFPKDVQGLWDIAKAIDGPTELLQATHRTNERQKRWMFEKVKKHFGASLRGKTIALWGIAFKPETNDIREAPGVILAEQLCEAGVQVRAYDPVANPEAKARFGSRVTVVDSSYAALEGADALAIATEWSEFRSPDFARMKKLLRNPVVIDGRNVYTRTQMIDQGFVHYAVGVPDAFEGTAAR